MAKIYVTTDDGEVIDVLHLPNETGWGDVLHHKLGDFLKAIDKAIHKSRNGY